jgi:GH35 family endo-1,4-beta-xylanase
MKWNRIYLPLAAFSMLMASCDDQKMEWATPDGHYPVTIAEMPLELAEQIANYDYIKAYAQKYTPNMTVGLGLGADLYISDEAYRQVANDNFQMLTTGNAMKHSSVVQANGSLNFSTIDAFLEAVPSDMQIYGHNFIWHTQQKQSYLKSLIAPEMQIEVAAGDVCKNVVDNYGFETGDASGWTGLWGKYTYAVESPGHDGDYAIHFTMTDATAVNYDSQLFWPTDLVVGETYAYSFYAKSDCNLTVQFLGQNASYSGIYRDSFTAGSDWTYCTGEFTYTEGMTADICRVGLQFGGTPGSNLWVDDFKFGVKNDGPYNYCTNGDFADGTEGWTLNNGASGVSVVSISDNPSGNKNVLQMTAPESSSNAWDLQVVSPKMPTLPGSKVELSFYVKSDQPGKGRVSYSSSMSNQWPWMNWTGTQASWTEAFETSTGWTAIDVVLQNYGCDFKDGESEWQFNLDFGYQAGVTYYIDDVKVTEVEETASSGLIRRGAVTRAGGITYKLKSAAEKRDALLGAMEDWIKGMYEHLNGRVLNYDVINEPIADNNQWRGVNGNFMGDDVAPEESEESGLSLNWDDDHFYWGYYIGEDYGVKAFEFARKYAPANSNLFVNEYGLESNPNKLAALLSFVDYIDNNGQHVDGIGTQMHVSTSITRAEVDAMFQKLAATGKLVRVTELDVQVGTKTPSTEQLAEQAETYQMIIESYLENVPSAQQSGITIWSLTDNAREHEYWLPDDQPNLFDANYGRKHAYKGVCDGLAGYDISTDFDGTMWNK